jgi:hypothetical protein
MALYEQIGLLFFFLIIGISLIIKLLADLVFYLDADRVAFTIKKPNKTKILYNPLGNYIIHTSMGKVFFFIDLYVPYYEIDEENDVIKVKEFETKEDAEKEINYYKWKQLKRNSA